MGAIGGAALVKLFPDRLFGYYCIGLAVGLFACVAAGNKAARSSRSTTAKPPKKPTS